MRAMSRIWSRRMKRVPARSAIQPAMGQSRISLLATKRVGRTLETRKMSTQATWLAAIITPASPPGGVPEATGVTLRMRNSFADHHRMSTRRRAAVTRG
jgi:hypothetical protein